MHREYSEVCYYGSFGTDLSAGRRLPQSDGLFQRSGRNGALAAVGFVEDHDQRDHHPDDSHMKGDHRHADRREREAAVHQHRARDHRGNDPPEDARLRVRGGFELQLPHVLDLAQ